VCAVLAQIALLHDLVNDSLHVNGIQDFGGRGGLETRDHAFYQIGLSPGSGPLPAVLLGFYGLDCESPWTAFAGGICCASTSSR
jgi:hypothetical protein